jgi:Pyrimidine dimer DNA glycosylase
MQTFLPYSDFTACARILDSKRLGKQRVETLQIVKALLQPDYGWRHHPAVLMWKGYEEALGRYGMEVCHAWRRRGFADTCEPKILADLGRLGLELVREQDELAAAGAVPPWLGDAALHRSHQSALLRKTPSCTDRPSPECPTTCPTCGRSAPSRRSRPNGAVSPRPSQARSAAPGAPRTRTRRASRPGRAAAQPARAGRAPARPSTRSGIQATAIDSPKSPEGARGARWCWVSALGWVGAPGREVHKFVRRPHDDGVDVASVGVHDTELVDTCLGVEAADQELAAVGGPDRLEELQPVGGPPKHAPLPRGALVG